VKGQVTTICYSTQFYPIKDTRGKQKEVKSMNSPLSFGYAFCAKKKMFYIAKKKKENF
jgi:hypothetical protein